MHRFRPVRMVVDRARQQGLTHTSISRLLNRGPPCTHIITTPIVPTRGYHLPINRSKLKDEGGRRFPPLIPTIVTMSVTITITIITKRRAEWSFTLPCREPSPLRPVSGSSDAISGTV